mgnify:CR=1 FL=1|tara:strand:+ start:117 stop:482 length:366 start_codon:yes stop_codon:yes gene_type:complete
MEIFGKFTKLFLPLIFVGLTFGTEASLNDEEVIQLFHSIQELEHKDSLNTSIINNLELQIVDYKNINAQNDLLITDYKKQLELSQEMIKLVKPKWYDNKYLWFFGGVLMTSGAVYLAGQID